MTQDPSVPVAVAAQPDAPAKLVELTRSVVLSAATCLQAEARVLYGHAAAIFVALAKLDPASARPLTFSICHDALTAAVEETFWGDTASLSVNNDDDWSEQALASPPGAFPVVLAADILTQLSVNSLLPTDHQLLHSCLRLVAVALGQKARHTVLAAVIGLINTLVTPSSLIEVPYATATSIYLSETHRLLFFSPGLFLSLSCTLAITLFPPWLCLLQAEISQTRAHSHSPGIFRNNDAVSPRFGSASFPITTKTTAAMPMLSYTAWLHISSPCKCAIPSDRLRF